MSTTTQNGMESLESALKRLDDMTGYGTALMAHVTATHVRGSTKHTAFGELESVASPLFSGVGNGIAQGVSGGGFFNLSESQIYSDIGSAISKATKRNL